MIIVEPPMTPTMDLAPELFRQTVSAALIMGITHVSGPRSGPVAASMDIGK